MKIRDLINFNLCTDIPSSFIKHYSNFISLHCKQKKQTSYTTLLDVDLEVSVTFEMTENK
jgi:hypothetical protein